MWRSALSARLLLRTVPPASTFHARPPAAGAFPYADHPIRPPWSPLCQLLSSSASSTASTSTPSSSSPAAAAAPAPGAPGGPASPGTAAGDPISFPEARRLMRLVNVESLKRKLEKEGHEVITYTDLVKVCEGMGIVRTDQEAEAFVKVLDEAGVVLLFRDKVYLHPDKVVDLMRKAVPLALTPEDDPRRLELKELQKKKEEIDVLAHRQVRRILWCGLGFSLCQISLFFRLTFWEFSWDVMEPIAFFTTTAGLIVGYAYFLFTSRDPTYQDLMHRLFQSRQRKLVQKHNFNLDRYLELQRHCKCPLDDPKGNGIESFLRD